MVSKFLLLLLWYDMIHLFISNSIYGRLATVGCWLYLVSFMASVWDFYWISFLRWLVLHFVFHSVDISIVAMVIHGNQMGWNWSRRGPFVHLVHRLSYFNRIRIHMPVRIVSAKKIMRRIYYVQIPSIPCIPQQISFHRPRNGIAPRNKPLLLLTAAQHLLNWLPLSLQHTLTQHHLSVARWRTLKNRAMANPSTTNHQHQKQSQNNRCSADTIISSSVYHGT